MRERESRCSHHPNAPAGNAISWVDGLQASGVPCHPFKSHGPKIILVWIIEMDASLRDLSSRFVFCFFFISTSDYLFCRILLAWSISRDVPLHNVSSTWQKWLTAWHNMAEVKNKASDMLKEITNNLSPSVQDHPCMCVVNRQRYNGAECQMCPCYIIDDSGKHKVRTGFPHQYPSFVCL